LRSFRATDSPGVAHLFISNYNECMRGFKIH